MERSGGAGPTLIPAFDTRPNAIDDSLCARNRTCAAANRSSVTASTRRCRVAVVAVAKVTPRRR